MQSVVTRVHNGRHYQYGEALCSLAELSARLRSRLAPRRAAQRGKFGLGLWTPEKLLTWNPGFHGSAQCRGAAQNFESAASQPEQKPSASEQGRQGQKQTYPLYPSVQALLSQNGLSEKDADRIHASGPKGRLLKGDVLAHLGHIGKDYPSQASKRLEKLSHLDLSNIQLAKSVPAEQKPGAKEAVPQPEPERPTETELAVPISLAQVTATQKKVQDALGVSVPLSLLIARASDLANENLPAAKGVKPTPDELFNSVLGLDKVGKPSRGHYVPEITSLSPQSRIPAAVSRIKPDIIDMLASKPPTAQKRSSPTPSLSALGVGIDDSIFSVTAKTGEERRATEYLQRMKMALENEPGRLIL